MERRQALHPDQEGPPTGALEAALAKAGAQLKEGRCFEAHETLELEWAKAQGELKTALQGLIQIAAGLHKRSQGGQAGAAYLLGRGIEKARRCGHALPRGAAAPFLKAAGSGR